MKRKDFLAYLARAVSEKFITEQEAVSLLRRFDAGEIADSILPLQLSEVITTTTRAEVESVLTAKGALSVIREAFTLRGLSEREQERIATQLQERFAENVRKYAKALAESQNLKAWESLMGQSIQENIISQSLVGRLRPLGAEEINVLDSINKTQQAFLTRFADELTARYLLGNPFSEGYIANRSEQYNGEARALFYREKEAESGDDEVFDYISLDDNSTTCQPCLDAEIASPYLASSGPMPGEICLGRGFCRCTREARYSPSEAAKLREGLRAA